MPWGDFPDKSTILMSESLVDRFDKKSLLSGEESAYKKIVPIVKIRCIDAGKDDKHKQVCEGALCSITLKDGVTQEIAARIDLVGLAELLNGFKELTADVCIGVGRELVGVRHLPIITRITVTSIDADGAIVTLF